MKLIFGTVLFVAALFTTLTTLLTTGTTSGERRWRIADLFARIVSALKPSSIMLAITAIIPALLLSTASVQPNDDSHNKTDHHRSRRFLWLLATGAFVLGLLTLLKSTLGGGGEKQQREHVGADTKASSTSEQAAAT